MSSEKEVDAAHSEPDLAYDRMLAVATAESSATNTEVGDANTKVQGEVAVVPVPVSTRGLTAEVGRPVPIVNSRLNPLSREESEPYSWPP